MSQDFAQLHRSRWSDTDWRALTPDAQWAYDMLLSHPDRNPAGLLPLTKKKWTKLAAGLTLQRLDAALAELDAAAFIVVDEDTQELLVRSFIRVAKIYKHIRLFANALQAISEVESDRLKSAIGQELVRLPRLEIPAPNGRNAVAVAEAEAAQRRLDDLASMLCDAPPDPPGQAADSSHAPSHAPSHGASDAPSHLLQVQVPVTGTAPGSCPSSEKKSLESNARGRPLTGLCPEHPGQSARNCPGCAADRKAAS